MFFGDCKGLGLVARHGQPPDMPRALWRAFGTYWQAERYPIAAGNTRPSPIGKDVSHENPVRCHISHHHRCANRTG
jgi:hypothetical protein